MALPNKPKDHKPTSGQKEPTRKQISNYYDKVFSGKLPHDLDRNISGITSPLSSMASVTASGTVATMINPALQDIYDNGRLPDIVRGNVLMTPYSVAQIGYLAQTQYQGSGLEMINGENRQVYTFTRGQASFKVIPVKGSPKGLEDIIDITGKIYDYCDINGLSKDQAIDINFNNFLDSLGYKRDADGSHDRKVENKVWQTILEISETPFNLVGGNNTTAIFRESLIKVTAVYDTKNQLKAVADYENKKPPSKFSITVLPSLYYQMKGFKDQTKYIPKNIVIKPKIPATKLNKEYQGGVKKCLDTLFYKIHDKPVGIRFIPTNELLEAWGGYQSSRSKKTNKLVNAFNLFEKDKILNEWGFAISRNKRLNKTYTKSPLIWVDIEDTDTYKQMMNFTHKTRSEKAKEREARKTKDRLRKLEKTINKNIKDGAIIR